MNRSFLSRLAPTGVALLNTIVNPAVRLLLRSPLRERLSSSILQLEYTGRRSGRRISLPVAYARHDPETLVIVPAAAEHKTWWHNFDGEPQPVDVIMNDQRLAGTATICRDEDRLADLRRVYQRRFGKRSLSVAGSPIVVEVSLAPAVSAAQTDATSAADLIDLTERQPPWVDDPAHAPGHRHRPLARSAPSKAPNPANRSGRDRPWIRRSHSDSQQRRWRRGR